MQPIELKLAAEPNDATTLHCSAFAVLAPRSGPSITDLLAFIASHPDYRNGTLYLLPAGFRDVSASGFVWFQSSLQSVKCPFGAVPLRKATATDTLPGSVWIPGGSRLSPNVDPQTLSRQLASDPLIRLWLPSVGLVGLGRDDQLRPGDWLSVPLCTEPSAWTTPPETWSPPSSIIELGMASPPSAESFFRNVQQEIGLPPRSLVDADEDGTGESKPSPAARAKNWLLGKLDAMVGKSKRDTSADPSKPAPTRAPASAPARSAKGQGAGLRSLAAPLAAAMSRLLQGERDRQIQKLLRMFESNPDAALKYAIPLGGISDAFRGFTMPGAALLERLVDFSLFGLRGGAGEPVDVWSIDFRLQNKLQAKYRDQANREMVAGRYRRGAYIYAHLLQDFRAAAQALERGKFYGEAAVIYRDHLADKRNAARCFASGGMHREACELLVDMKLYESAGDVLLEAGLEAEAREMFENALNEELSKGAILSAARILSQRLQQRSDAIELLCNQWPDGHEPVQASELAMQWLGEDGLHDQSLAQINKMSEQACDWNYADFAYLSQRVAERYPDRGVRAAAEDHCRLAVARSLRRSSPQAQWKALGALGRLDASDPQLRRDSQKYSARGKSKQRGWDRGWMDRRWTRLPDLCLPSGVQYVDFRVERGQLFALSARDDRLFLTHLPLPEPNCDVNITRSVDLNASSPRLSRADAFLKNISFESSLAVRAVACAPSAAEVFLNADRAPVLPLPSLLIENDSLVCAAVASPDGVWQVQRLDGNIVLGRSHGPTFDLTGIWAESWPDTGYPITGDSCERISLCVVNGVPIVALDHVLVTLHYGQIRRIRVLDEPAWALSGSLPRTRTRIVVSHCSGMEVVNLDTYEVVNVCRQRGYTLCQWALGGRLIAWSDGVLHCFESRAGSYARIAESRDVDRGEEPIGLLSLSSSIIGVTYANGSISRYRLPR